jgi:hypothetical protein
VTGDNEVGGTLFDPSTQRGLSPQHSVDEEGSGINGWEIAKWYPPFIANHLAGNALKWAGGGLSNWGEGLAGDNWTGGFLAISTGNLLNTAGGIVDLGGFVIDSAHEFVDYGSTNGWIGAFGTLPLIRQGIQTYTGKDYITGSNLESYEYWGGVAQLTAVVAGFGAYGVGALETYRGAALPTIEAVAARLGFEQFEIPSGTVPLYSGVPFPGNFLKASTYAKIFTNVVERTITRSIGEIRAAGLIDAHHVIQDAAVRDLAGYDTNAAPGVQLPGPSTAEGTPHYNATMIQRQAGGGTYGAERQISYKALRAAGYSESQATRAIQEADTYFNSIGVTENTPTRTVGNRKLGK